VLLHNSPVSSQTLLEFDRRHVWHPYSVPSVADEATPEPRYLVRGAEGSEIELASGERLVDGMASWWSAVLGYRHPALVAAVQNQAAQLSHVMFGGLTHEPAILLAKRLLKLVPPSLERVFFCDSGSVSVEVALKLARQYAQAIGQRSRTRLLTVRHGYHGDTWGAMSVCDPEQGMHRLFAGSVEQQVFLPAPTGSVAAPAQGSDVAALERALAEHGPELCAFILEPVVQNAGGLRFYSADYLRHARALCDRHGLLLIFDEIATGFHRTGPCFALEHAGVAPDILCIGKALSGGMLSLAATLTSARVSEAIARAEPFALMHGPTFMANPLACAAANATLTALAALDAPSRVAALSAQLEQELAPARGNSAVADVRVCGAIGVIELKTPVDLRRAVPFAVQHGVWLRPFGRYLYTMPPLTIESAQLSRVTSVMSALAADAS
jgi:adenosylmethionine---8-amino-7-oxononanoate aminotransferase